MNCGTTAGYARHIAWRTRPCDDCREAHNAYRRHIYHNPKGRERPPPSHGTVAGYRRHYTNRETPCDPCRLARNAYQREWYAAHRSPRKPTIAECILDVLETHGSSIGRLSLTSWVVEIHPDWLTESIRRTLQRLVDDGRVERVEFGEEIRFRLA